MNHDHNGSKRHMLLMAVCCLAPLAVLAVLWAAGVQLGSLGLVLMILVCPLAHLFMMRGMGHDHSQAAPPREAAPSLVAYDEPSQTKQTGG